MKWSHLKKTLASALVFGLTTQSVLSYGLTVNVPQTPVSVKYPKTYQALIDEVTTCVLEAEQEIYDAKTLKTLPKLTTSETRTCREILKTKLYKNNITFEVDYSQNHADFEEDGALIIYDTTPQAPLTILDAPLALKDSPYLKDTETLEIAMRMFQDLNIGLKGDLAVAHKENDILDVLYLRIFNMVYELPKVQGHPLMIEFMKDVRDNFFRVSSSQFFRALIWYAYKNNPDKEISRTLNLYLHQLEYAGIDPGNETPNENLVLPGESHIVDTTPPLGDSDQIAQEDFENFWDDAYEEIIAEEEKEDAGMIYNPSEPSISYETLKTYEVKGGVCMRVTTTLKNGKETNRVVDKAPSEEIYRCGDASLMGAVSTPEDSDDFIDWANPIISYRLGGEAGEWVHTTLKAPNGELSFTFLSDLLSTIASENGAGCLKENDRWLFILSGKPLYLKKYKETLDVPTVNNWLAKHQIDLELGLNIEKQQEQEEFFEWSETNQN